MQPDGTGFEPELLSIGRRVRVYEGALILRPLSVILDDDVRVDKGVRIEGGEFCWIGCNTHLAKDTSIHGGGECIVGAHVAIGQGVKIITGVGHPGYLNFPVIPPGNDVAHIKRGRVVIGDYAFIGDCVEIHMNVTIGEGAVIAAGTSVARDIPPWSIVAGNPARIIGQRENWMKGESDG